MNENMNLSSVHSFITSGSMSIMREVLEEWEAASKKSIVDAVFLLFSQTSFLKSTPLNVPPTLCSLSRWPRPALAGLLWAL